MFGLGSQSQLGIGIAIMLDDRFSGKAAKVNQQLLAMRKNANSSITSAMQSYRNNAATISGGAAAISYGMLSAAKAGSEFEHRINQVAIVGGNNLKRTRAELTQFANNLSKDFNKTPLEISEALFENIKAGVTSNLEEITRYQIAAATATDEQLSGKGGVAEKLLGITNAMGMAYSEFGRVANATTAVSNATMANVYDIGEAMEYAAFTARSFNIPLEETLAMVGMLSQAKIHGSAAGTALNNYMMMLGKSLGPFATPRSKKAWEMLGLDTNVITGMVNRGEIGQVTASIQQATAGMDPTTRKSILQALFNMRGTRGVEGIMELLNPKEGQATMAQILAAAKQGVKEDIAIKQSRQMMQDLFSDFKFMANAFHRFRIKFTEAAGPFIRVMMGVGIKALGFLSDIVSTPVGKVLAGVAAAAAPIIAIMFAFRTAVLTSIIALRGFSGASATGGFWNLVGAGLGSIGKGKMAAAGVTRNAAGRLMVAAGQTVNFGGKLYKGGQLLPATFGAGLGRFWGGAAAGAAGSAATGFFSKATPWLGRVASFGGKMLPVVGWIWGIYEVLKWMWKEEQGKTQEREKNDEFLQDYYRHLDEQFMGKAASGSWYKYQKTPYGMKFDPYNKLRAERMQQQINIFVDGTKTAEEKIDTSFEDNINSILNFSM